MICKTPAFLSKQLFYSRNKQFDQNYMTVKVCVDFVVKAIDHTDGNVREAAIAFLAEIHKAAISQGESPTYVRRLLPRSQEEVGKYDIIWRNIYDTLDRAEGKPTAAELAAARLQDAARAEEKKRNEIEALQNQIAELKNLQNQVGGGAVNPNPNKNNNNSSNMQTNSNSFNAGNLDTSLPKNLPPENLATEANPEDDFNEDNQCIFCGERNDDFIGDDEKGLDLHYWKYCPMLKRCEYCGQVTEIPAFHEHILTECDARASGKIPEEVISLMQKEKNNKFSHCSLCKKKVDGTEEGWQKHLMSEGKNACLANPRRIPYLNRMKNTGATR